MAATSRRYAEQLRAVGRLLDQRETVIRHVCLVETSDGFVANVIERWRADAYANLPATVTFGSAELRAALAGPARQRPARHDRR